MHMQIYYKLLCSVLVKVCQNCVIALFYFLTLQFLFHNFSKCIYIIMYCSRSSGLIWPFFCKIENGWIFGIMNWFWWYWQVRFQITSHKRMSFIRQTRGCLKIIRLFVSIIYNFYLFLSIDTLNVGSANNLSSVYLCSSSSPEISIVKIDGLT